jgi:hypothetical protein
MKRYPWLVILISLLVFSLACQSVPFLAHPTPTPTTTPTPTFTPTPTKTSTPTKTFTPTGVEGITTPVTVNGVELKFTRLHKESEIVFGNDRYTPKNSSDIFAVAEADVLTSGISHSEVAGWTVTLNDSIGWSLMQSRGNINSINSVEWVFVVSKSLTTFRINLPGGVDVVLTSLLQ